jgi:hypothetical protein
MKRKSQMIQQAKVMELMTEIANQVVNIFSDRKLSS